MILGKVLADWRHLQRLPLEEAAKQMGIHKTTLWRLEQGAGVQGDSLAIVLTWLMTSPMEKTV